jgi:hypothetical protein
MDAQRIEERADETVDLGLGTGFEKYRECPVSALFRGAPPFVTNVTRATRSRNLASAVVKNRIGTLVHRLPSTCYRDHTAVAPARSSELNSKVARFEGAEVH